MKRLLFLMLLLPFALAAQGGEVDFYVKLTPPPLLDLMWDIVEIRSGFYLSETEALEEHTPIELATVRFDDKGLKTIAGDESTDGKPMILLEIDSLDYRGQMGMDRDFNGRECREIVVKIPFAHSAEETLRAHIFCPSPTPHDPENYTVAHRYVGAGETHYELVAVRIFRKPQAPPLSETGKVVSTGGENRPPKPTSDVTGSSVSRQSHGGGGSSNWYYTVQQLKRDAERLKDMEDAEERAAERQRIEGELAKIEDIDAVQKDVDELKAQLEESAPREPQTNVEMGEDIYAEFVPPQSQLPNEDMRLGIAYNLNEISMANMQKPDIRVGVVQLVSEQHKTRPGDGYSGGKPCILLNLPEWEVLRGLMRQSVWNDKPCREVVVEVTFGNPGEKKMPAHIYCPSLYSATSAPKQDLFIDPQKTDRVFVAVRIFEKKAEPQGTMPEFVLVRHFPRFVRTRVVHGTSMSGVYTTPEYIYSRDLGLITLSGTGKFNDHVMNSGVLEDEWLEVGVTDLGQRYLIPETLWSDNDRKVMNYLFEGWSHSALETEDNPEIVEQYNKALEQGWGFPERDHKGELYYLRAVFDHTAIQRDIASGKLKSPE